ncbi:NfeD family protein [Cryobacterium sp.]|jgi:membrane protein implicated in regulation of membrane protease activity|uniref:NfeD family protein n=1 Tax=Cryobacterium sp. TaxID=1926290 RepID=UPI00262D2C88|nr:NfeD family protein [Cryobacterium sp.]MCU1445725.1 rane protein [Cryobacterium sp.]
MVDLTDYLWIAWLVFILVCVIIELLTLDFTFLMIAVGSVAGLGANLLGWDWWVQILVAAAVSVLLLLLIRPVLLHAMARQSADVPPSNVAALIGMGGRVSSTVGDLGGLVKLDNGETWTAHLSPGQAAVPIDPGHRVRVLAIDGSTAFVTPAERS